jgi:hypothetical protein
MKIHFFALFMKSLPKWSPEIALLAALGTLPTVIAQEQNDVTPSNPQMTCESVPNRPEYSSLCSTAPILKKEKLVDKSSAALARRVAACVADRGTLLTPYAGDVQDYTQGQLGNVQEVQVFQYELTVKLEDSPVSFTLTVRNYNETLYGVEGLVRDSIKLERPFDVREWGNGLQTETTRLTLFDLGLTGSLDWVSAGYRPDFFRGHPEAFSLNYLYVLRQVDEACRPDSKLAPQTIIAGEETQPLLGQEHVAASSMPSGVSPGGDIPRDSSTIQGGAIVRHPTVE